MHLMPGSEMDCESQVPFPQAFPLPWPVLRCSPQACRVKVIAEDRETALPPKHRVRKPLRVRGTDLPDMTPPVLSLQEAQHPRFPTKKAVTSWVLPQQAQAAWRASRWLQPHVCPGCGRKIV